MLWLCINKVGWTTGKEGIHLTMPNSITFLCVKTVHGLQRKMLFTLLKHEGAGECFLSTWEITINVV